MLARFFAAWLVALIVLPFSAPFSTCDAASLFASEDLSEDAALTIESVGAADDAGTTHALPVRNGSRQPKPLASTGRTSFAKDLPPSEPFVQRHTRPEKPAGAQRALPLRV